MSVRGVADGAAAWTVPNRDGNAVISIAHALRKPPKAKRPRRATLPTYAPRDRVAVRPIAEGPAWGARDALLARNLGHIMRDATPWAMRAPMPWRAAAGWLTVTIVVLVAMGAYSHG